MNNTFYSPNDYRNYLEHHGVKGMKWGVRRYQNADGSYTSAGKSHYGVQGSRGSSGGTGSGKRARSQAEIDARNKKIAKIALAVTGTAAVAAGAYVAHKYLQNTDLRVDKLANSAKSEAVAKNLDSIFAHMDAKAKESELGVKAARAGDISGKWEHVNNMSYHNKEISDLNAWNRQIQEGVADKNYRRQLRKEVIKDDIDRFRQRRMADRMGYKGIKLDRTGEEQRLRAKASEGLKTAAKQARIDEVMGQFRGAHPDRVGGSRTQQLKEAAARHAGRLAAGYRNPVSKTPQDQLKEAAARHAGRLASGYRNPVSKTPEDQLRELAAKRAREMRDRR